MRVIVLHNTEVPEDPDILLQRDVVLAALRESGHVADSIPCTLDLQQVAVRLREWCPDVVFNLVESLGGTDRLAILVPFLLETMGIPYTGTASMGMLGLCNKVAAKKKLREAGLPTPCWWDSTLDPIPVGTDNQFPGRWIIKPIWEHASLGMDDAAVVYVNDYEDLRDSITQREAQMACPLFAESFVDGREFNLSIFLGDVLPPAEIDFSAFPSDKPQIVGQKAKWDPNSFEYQQTPRRFQFPPSDAELLRTLKRLSVECWNLFGLSGFARVDFRVDRLGSPWILEVNVNPCLSPDAGFPAAAAEAGFSFAEVIDRLVKDVAPSRRDVQKSAGRVFV